MESFDLVSNNDEFVYNGKHLMIDGLLLEGSPNLNDANHGCKVINEIIQELDMTAILPPISVHFPHAIAEAQRIAEALKKEGLGDSKTYHKIMNDLQYRSMQSCGYSVFGMIAESHLTLHTFPSNNFFSFDAYSCKDFDENKIVEILKRDFGNIKMNIHVIKRTVPKNID